MCGKSHSLLIRQHPSILLCLDDFDQVDASPPREIGRLIAGVSLLQIIPWLSYSVSGVLNLSVFTIDTGIALSCYLLCVITDPGR